MMAVISWRRVGGWGRVGCAAVAAGPAGPQVDGRGADADVDRGDGGMGWAAVVAVQVPGGGAFDLAGAAPRAAGGQQGGQNSPADGAGQVGRASGQMPRAAVSSSRAASIAVVKLAWSGSVPGQVSTAETMAMRSSR
jgi:hypothetical protein